MILNREELFLLVALPTIFMGYISGGIAGVVFITSSLTLSGIVFILMFLHNLFNKRKQAKSKSYI